MKDIVITLIAIVAVVIALIALITTPQTLELEPTTFEKIVDEGKLTACYVPWPPSVIKDPDTGEVSGFLIDITEMVAEDAELELEYVESTWGGFTADLKTGKCDAAIAGLYPTIGRSTSVAFTDAFFYAGNSIVVSADETEIKDIDDLNSKDVKLAVIQGEYGYIYAQKYLPEAELVVLDKSADLTMPLVSVSTGKADAGFSATDTINEYLKEQSEVKDLLGEPYSTTPITWAVRTEDQQLLNFLNNALDYLESSGDLANTAASYDCEWLKVEKEYVAVS